MKEASFGDVVDAMEKRADAERRLLAFLREPPTRTALQEGAEMLSYVRLKVWPSPGDRGERLYETLEVRLRTLLAKIDALGDAGTDDGGQP